MGKRRDAAAAIAGVDGTPAGWVVVAGEDARGDVRAFCVKQLADLPRDLRVVAVDVPIGLAERGPRLADHLARRALGPRGSSVFPTPVRAVLGARSWEDACARHERVDGRRVSKQTFGSWGRSPRRTRSSFQPVGAPHAVRGAPGAVLRPMGRGPDAAPKEERGGPRGAPRVDRLDVWSARVRRCTPSGSRSTGWLRRSGRRFRHALDRGAHPRRHRRAAAARPCCGSSGLPMVIWT